MGSTMNSGQESTRPNGNDLEGLDALLPTSSVAYNEDDANVNQRALELERIRDERALRGLQEGFNNASPQQQQDIQNQIALAAGPGGQNFQARRAGDSRASAATADRLGEEGMAPEVKGSRPMPSGGQGGTGVGPPQVAGGLNIGGANMGGNGLLPQAANPAQAPGQSALPQRQVVPDEEGYGPMPQWQYDLLFRQGQYEPDDTDYSMPTLEEAIGRPNLRRKDEDK